METAVKRASILGCDLLIVDGNEEFSRLFLREAVAMNASYQGYPLGTPMGRAFTVMAAAKVLQESEGSEKTIIHGCVANQNTLKRIERLASLFGLKTYAPFVAMKPIAREEKCELLREHGVEINATDGYSTDDNLWSRAIEGTALNEISKVVDEGRVFAHVKPVSQTPNEPCYVRLTFEQGRLAELDGRKAPLHEILVDLHRKGSEHGVGRIMVIEDTVFGEKIRDFYEAPASKIVIEAHKLVEACVLKKEERDEKEALDKAWGERVYAGEWLESETRQIAKRGWQLQRKVSGTVVLKLFKGNVEFMMGEIPHSRLRDAGSGMEH